MNDQKSIPGYENYHIHKDGFVINTKTGRILKPGLASKGYYLITLSNKKNSKREYIHRLIAQAWVPNLENKPHINHINGVMTDNRVENLEWCTPKENINHAYRIGLCPTSLKALQGGKLTEMQVLEIRDMLQNHVSVDHLAKVYNMHTESIKNIRKRKTWNHI